METRSGFSQRGPVTLKRATLCSLSNRSKFRGAALFFVHPPDTPTLAIAPHSLSY